MKASGDAPKTFGAKIRRAREKREIGLRVLALRLGVSATYLSQIERGVLPPPAENTIIAMAHELRMNSDILLADAGKIAPDLRNIIVRNPTELPVVVRACTDKATLLKILWLIGTEGEGDQRPYSA